MPEGPEKPKEKLIAEDPSQAAVIIGKLVTGQLSEDEVDGVMIYGRTILDVVPNDAEEEPDST